MATRYHRFFIATVTVVLASIFFMIEVAQASPNGRIRFSGDPLTGGQDCTVCHEAGAPVPAVTITGPTVVDADTTNEYTVTVSGGPAQTGGVNISASNPDQFVGELAPTSGDLQLLFSELTHTAPKTFSGGSVDFTFTWTAPEFNGDVILYAAGNSANADGNLTGDGVDTASLGITVQNGSPTPPPPPPAPDTEVTLEQYTSGLDRPVVIANTGIAGDERLLVAEQVGRIRVVDAGGALRAMPFLDITGRVDSNGNEKGLLGLAFHPEYASNGHFFVNYSRPAGSGFRTRISRFTVSGDPNVADPNSELVLMEYAQPFSNHNGGDIHFGPDGYLYIASGDGGSQGDPQNNAQNNLQLLGKLLRIDVDSTTGPGPDCDISGNQNYTIPPGNAFADGDGGAGCDEIWATGLRNPWRFSFDRQGGDLWIADVGQNAFEEVNYAPVSAGAGVNYGWRCFEGNSAFNTSGCPPMSELTFPVHAFAHSDGDNCSVTGGYVYRGEDFPDLFGQYFFTDFCNASIRTLSGPPTDPTVTVVLPAGQSVSLPATFGEDIRGELYVASHGSNAIYRVIGSGAGDDIVFEDDFETDKGWIPNPDGTDTATTGQWERADPQETNSSGPKQLGTTTSGSFDLVTGGAAGTSVGTNDIDNGVTSIRSPGISLPAGNEITLAFNYYMSHTSNSSADDFFRVTVESNTDSLVLEELGAANDDDAAWERFSADITAFAGETVTILIEAADNAGGSIVEAAVDDLVITAVPDGGGNEIFADDFETDQGWTTDPGGSDTATTGQWERANPETTSTGGITLQLGTTNSGSFGLVTAGAAGGNVGANDIDAGVTSIRSPDIVLPDEGTLTLSFAYYLAHLNNATSADFLRVTVVGNTASVVFEELGSADNDGAAWDTFSVDISGFAGQTVNILVEAADDGSPSLVEAGIDDVVITGGGDPGTAIVDAGFDTGADGFSYSDDTFRGTNQPAYASGLHQNSGGNPGGVLRVELGGIDDDDITDLSGGWGISFNLSETADVSLAFDYNLTQQPDYESDEFSEVLATVDGMLFVVATVDGDGNGGPPVTTGWQTFQTSLGTLPAGNHTLVVGGFNNKKTLANEFTEVLVDNVLLTTP